MQEFESIKFVNPLLAQILGVVYIQEKIGLAGSFRDSPEMVALLWLGNV